MWFLVVKLWLFLLLANLTKGLGKSIHGTAAVPGSTGVFYKPSGWLKSHKMSLPVAWSPRDLVEDPLFHTLDEHCPAEFRQPRGQPRIVPVDKRVDLSHACARMRLHPDVYIHPFWCKQTVDKEESFCSGRQVAWSIVRVLPQDLVRTIAAHGGLNKTELALRLEEELMVGDTGTRHYQLLWLEKNSIAMTEVCWPRRPGFSPGQFIDVMGYMSALLTDPKTISAQVPLRFMDFPPGPIRQDVYHQLDWKSYHTYPLLTLLRSEFIAPAAYIGTSEARNEIDKWSGALGRVLLATLDPDNGYSCPPEKTCFTKAVTSCNLPIVPGTARDVLRLFAIALELRIPLVVGWETAQGAIPDGIWLLIYKSP
ncbi:hypothetical protein CDD81_4852 [Ophiocordyceps australis]|uniref:Uncharacterized protein n=1 Tax=Ophiocordyceps australis TaxID=1399860 RepID=A0A2C5XIV2_9HYPO|nr:hypothetical protein CDD81_4852 [Ophiocordyceps australis]